MDKLYSDQVLLPEGWAERVAIGVAADGRIAGVETGVDAGGLQRLAGPVLPGMPNLHSHAFQRVMAGLAESAEHPEDSFWTWREIMYRIVGRLTPEQVEVIAHRLYVEMLKAGYTSVGEFHYLHHAPHGRPYADPAEMAERVVAAAERAGIGISVLPVLYAHSGFGGRPPLPAQRRFVHDAEGYLRLLQSLNARHGQHRLRRVGAAFHSLRGITPAELAAVLPAIAPASPIHIHIAEQRREVDDCLAWSGRRPIDWLCDHAELDRRWCLVHATHASEDEIRRVAASEAVIGLCPTTEANLGDGVFPAVPFVKAGGCFGIGSDSHVSVNVVEELRWLEYGQRLTSERRNRLASPTRPSVGAFLYTGAVAGGTRALGQPAGRIAPGSRADLVVLDGAHPLLAHGRGDRLLDRWLFAGDPAMVRDVMVGGKWVVRERRHDREEESAREFAAVVRALEGDH